MHTVETIRQSLLAPEKVEADLGMKPGDALVFDKSLLHEVEEGLDKELLPQVLDFQC